MQTVNLLCCQEPLDLTEVQTLARIPSRFTDNGDSTDQFDSYEFKLAVNLSDVRLRHSDSIPVHSYEKLEKGKLLNKKNALTFIENRFNPDRVFQGLLRRIPMEVMEMVAACEHDSDVFFEDKEWVGLHITTVIGNILCRIGVGQIRLVTDKLAWYQWNGCQWVLSDESSVTNYI